MTQEEEKTEREIYEETACRGCGAPNGQGGAGCECCPECGSNNCGGHDD